jgi:hypothetical protein
LSQPADTTSKTQQLLQIRSFVEKSAGLTTKQLDDVVVKIFQRTDGKNLSFSVDQLDEVIERVDADGKGFLQVNFVTGKKILLTDNLIGFKPIPALGLDMSKLPKVVTTPDLISVVDAIEDSILSGGESHEEVDVLKKVFDSVLKGAEAIGFDTTAERMWLQNVSRSTQASA